MVLANATTYLDAFGHVVAACWYFFRYELRGVYNRFVLVASLDDACLTMKPVYFTGQ